MKPERNTRGIRLLLLKRLLRAHTQETAGWPRCDVATYSDAKVLTGQHVQT